MTPDRWERMPWHAQARYLAQLRAEIAAHEQRVAAIRGRDEARAARLTESRKRRAEAQQAHVAATTARAEAILATLPIDPDAAQHRAALWQATRPERTTQHEQ